MRLEKRGCAAAATLWVLCSMVWSFPEKTSQAADWPNWLGPDKNGKSNEVLPENLDLTKELWKQDLGIGFSAFSISSGQVFTMGHREGKESLWCFDEADGSLLWKDEYPAELMPNLHEGGPGATPSIDKERVYAISKDGQLRVYTKDSGKLLWEKNMPKLAGMYRKPEWGFTASPYLYKDTVLIEAGATFCFDQKSGELRWQSEEFRPAYGSPHLFSDGSKDCFAILKTDGLIVLDALSGKTLASEVWRTSFQTNSTTPMSVAQNQLFISTGYDRGCALFRYKEGGLHKIYENQNMCNHMGNSVLLDGYLYGFDGTAHRGRPVELTCIDAATGQKKWHDPQYKYGSVLAVGEDLVLLTETGLLLVGKADPSGFQARVREQVINGRCWTPPVFANGKLYIRNAEGSAICLELNAPQ